MEPKKYDSNIHPEAKWREKVLCDRCAIVFMSDSDKYFNNNHREKVFCKSCAIGVGDGEELETVDIKVGAEMYAIPAIVYEAILMKPRLVSQKKEEDISLCWWNRGFASGINFAKDLGHLSYEEWKAGDK